MFDFHWIDPTQRAFAGRQRLDDLAAVLARRDGVPMLPAHRGRDTLRLRLAETDGTERTVYVKRERAARTKDLSRHAFHGRGFWTLARGEFEVLQRLKAAGIACPRPLVCLQQGVLPVRGCLIVDELPGAVPLASFLASQLRDDGPQRREAFFTALAQEVARLHAAGIEHDEFYASHICVNPAGGAWRISFLDFQRSSWSRRLPLSARIADLSALMATLPRRLADARDREAFFDAYLLQAELEDRGTDILQGVAARVEKLLTLRRIWEVRESDTEEHQAVHSLESVETGRMWIDRDFRPALDARGLSSFQSVMTTTRGRLLRSLPDRENWRLELHEPHVEPRGAYLKRHHVRGTRAWIRARLGVGPGLTAGRVEARNVARLARAGIAAMRLIAYGEKLNANGLLESFVLTEELVGYTQLDHFLRQRFVPRPSRQAWQRDPQLERLIRDVADVASKFHRLGYNHRDLYCCHFFINEPAPGQYKINLIDLQRVEHRHRFRGRWLVKDLAQLAYSAPRDRIGCTQRLAFMKRYLGVRKLRPQDKRLIREVLAKQRLMERNLGAHP
jgi:heptose I phosphotransferase